MTQELGIDIRCRGAGPPSIVVHHATRVALIDCLNSRDPFVAIEVRATGTAAADIILEPDLARQLHHKLGKLFPGDDVVGKFEELFSMELSCANLEELRNRTLPQQASCIDCGNES